MSVNGFKDNGCKVKVYTQDEVDELLSLELITVMLSTNQTTSSADEKINLDRVWSKYGNKLTLSDDDTDDDSKHKVVIGKNISDVEISVTIHLLYNSPVGGTGIKLMKNNSEIMVMSGYKSNTGQGEQLVLTPITVTVSEGDKIWLKYVNSGHSLTGYRTYMTVKKIK